MLGATFLFVHKGLYNGETADKEAGGIMPEDLPMPKKSLKQLEKGKIKYYKIKKYGKLFAFRILKFIPKNNNEKKGKNVEK